MVFLFQAFPCLCVMTTERANHIYEHIFRVIENDFKLKITKAWIDYEVALRDAISKIYPHIVLRGFWYQFCLAIRRKCKQIPDFYETIWSNDASSLFHQFLCFVSDALVDVSGFVNVFFFGFLFVHALALCPYALHSKHLILLLLNLCFD